VMRLMIVQGVALASGGIAIGLAAATALTPVLRTQLFGIGVLDPPTLLGIPVLLIAIAAVACYLPARRAMTIDPVNALRV